MKLVVPPIMPTEIGDTADSQDSGGYRDRSAAKRLKAVQFNTEPPEKAVRVRHRASAPPAYPDRAEMDAADCSSDRQR